MRTGNVGLAAAGGLPRIGSAGTESHVLDVEVAGFQPLDVRVGGLRHHDRVGRPVLDVAQAASRGTVGNRVRTDDHRVAGLRAVGFRFARATKDRGRLLRQRHVVRAVPRLVKAVLGIQVVFAQERQDQHPPTVLRLAVLVGNEGGREAAVLLMVSLHRQSDAFQVPGTLRDPGRLSRRLDRRQQKGEERAKNVNANEEENKKKTIPQRAPTQVQPGRASTSRHNAAGRWHGHRLATVCAGASPAGAFIRHVSRSAAIRTGDLHRHEKTPAGRDRPVLYYIAPSPARQRHPPVQLLASARMAG